MTLVSEPGRVRRPAWQRGVAALGLTAIVAATIGGLWRVTIDTGVESFLSSRHEAAALEDKAEAFGGDPLVVLLRSPEPAQLLLEPESLARLVGLEGALATTRDVASVYGPGTVLNQTAGAIQNLLATISGRRDALGEETRQVALNAGVAPAQAQRLADAAIARFDDRYGALLVRGLPVGLPTLKNQKFVANVVFAENGDPKQTWQFLVPAEDVVTVLVRPREGLDQEGASDLTEAVTEAVADSGLPVEDVVVTGVPVLTSSLADRAATEMVRLGGAAAVAVGLVLLLMPWSRGRLRRLLPMLAAGLGAAATVSVFGWIDRPLSLGVVAFLPILLGIGSDFPIYLLGSGLQRRTLAAAGAAVAGFASLGVSTLPFVRELGLALAGGVAATVAVALLVRLLAATGPPSESRATAESFNADSRAPWRLRAAALVPVLILAGVGWALLPHLDVETQVESLAEGLPELADVQTAEQVLGSAGEVSLVLRGPDVTSLEALAWARRAQESIAVAHADELRPILTISDLFGFLGPEPSQAQVQAAFDILPPYLTSAVVVPDRSQTVLTYGVRLDDVEEQGALLTDVRASLPRPPGGYTVDLVGLPVAAAAAVDAVAEGRLWINLVGIGLALLVLLVVLWERRTLLAALMTVGISTGLVFLVSYVTVGSLNPLTVATGSLLTATGCEFAVMLGRDGRPNRHALVAVSTAALAATAGYAVLWFSDLAVLRDFGLLLSVSVVLSYLSALLVTWALSGSQGGSDVAQREPNALGARG